MGPFGCNEEKGTAVKRCAKLMIAFGTAATLMGCGAALADEAAAAAPGSPQEIVAAIQDDFAATTENLTAGLAQVDETIGGTFEGYLANEQVLADWYGTVVDETEALFERTNENAMAYYRAVAGTVDHGDSDALEDAMDELYDAVYEDACEDYHDDVYEDLLEEAYDAYYDGIIDDAEDSVAFDVWLDARSGAYSDWLDVRSDVYSAYLDVRSDLYGDIIDVKSAFWQGVFDIDAVVVVLPEVQLDPAKLVPVAHDGTPEGILAAIEGDFAATAEGLAASLEDARVAVGDTFDGYVANEQTVLAWYASAIGETEALYARTCSGLAQYYEAVMATVDHGDFSALSDAIDEAYDCIYDDASGDYYDAVYEDLFDDAYDYWYDGVIDDAGDELDYTTWSLVSGRSYRACDRARTQVYRAIDDGKTVLYRDWSDVNDAIYDDLFDVAEILDMGALLGA